MKTTQQITAAFLRGDLTQAEADAALNHWSQRAEGGGLMANAKPMRWLGEALSQTGERSWAAEDYGVTLQGGCIIGRNGMRGIVGWSACVRVGRLEVRATGKSRRAAMAAMRVRLRELCEDVDAMRKGWGL